MKKLLCVLVLILALTCIFAACDNFEGSTPPDAGESGETPPVHTHVYGEWTIVAVPNCVTDGQEKRVCACGESETRPLAATGLHNYNVNNVCRECNKALQYTEGLKYSFINSAVCVLEGIGTAVNEETIVIPPYHDQMPVIMIEGRAFENNTRITQISIPDTVISIGEDAFSGCINLLQVEDGIIYVDKWAISCDKEYSPIIFREGTVGIVHKVFSDLEDVSNISISIPKSVKHVYSSPNMAEGSANFLEKENGIYYVDKWVIGSEIDILAATLRPDTVGIAGGAFAGKGITSINIPAPVENIGYAAFYECTQLTDVVFAQNSELDNILPSVFEGCENLKNISIPSKVKEIGYMAFAGCGELVEISIPLETTTIGEYAFYEAGIESIKIPSNVKVIGYGAFQDCRSLESVIFEKTDGWSNSLNGSNIILTEDFSANATLLKNAYFACYNN